MSNLKGLLNNIEKKEKSVSVKPVDFNKQVNTELLNYISNNYFKDYDSHA